MLNLTDCTVSFCVTLLVTSASLHVNIVAAWTDERKPFSGSDLRSVQRSLDHSEQRFCRSSNAPGFNVVVQAAGVGFLWTWKQVIGAGSSMMQKWCRNSQTLRVSSVMRFRLVSTTPTERAIIFVIDTDSMRSSNMIQQQSSKLLKSVLLELI